MPDMTAAAPSRRQVIGNLILLLLSALLTLHGIVWIARGPATALESIAKRTVLEAADFQEGAVSAADVIALTNRNYAVLEITLGLLAGLLLIRALRETNGAGWWAMWALVAGFWGLAANFVVVGGLGGGSTFYLALAVLALAGQLLTRPSPQG